MIDDILVLFGENLIPQNLTVNRLKEVRDSINLFKLFSQTSVKSKSKDLKQ